MAMIEEFLTGEEGSYDSVMADGRIVWDSISSYFPTPLEVLRNPWIQWVVLLPRDIGGALHTGIPDIAPPPLRPPGPRTRVPPTEGVRPPRGPAAGSPAAAPPPAPRPPPTH